jgi:hypothetical protein
LAVVIVNSNKKNKKKQFVQTLTDLAEKNNCKISEHDLWNNSLIGIDTSANQLFFIRKNGENAISNVIDLQGIQKCRVINSSRVVTNKDSNHTVTDKIELALTSPDAKISDTILEIYNTNRDNLFLNGELPLAEKWAAIVNTNIAGITKR